jgi:hypothetical protein
MTILQQRSSEWQLQVPDTNCYRDHDTIESYNTHLKNSMDKFKILPLGSGKLVIGILFLFQYGHFLTVICLFDKADNSLLGVRKQVYYFSLKSTLWSFRKHSRQK